MKPKMIRDENNTHLRKIENKDREAFCSLFGYPLDDERSILFMQTLMNQYPKKEYYSILDAKSQVVGIIEVNHINRNTIEIGYRIHKQYQRKGYATHSVKQLLERLQNTEIHTVIARVEKENSASMKVLENTGFMRKVCKDTVCIYEMEVIYDSH